eukprot:m.317371 g.317371  ORF g.317371 m.317371 type:complete len:381 (+) comp20284_c0_seq73:166-1308(+)
MASKTGTLVPGNYSDCMVKKVSYKGFIHCDNKAREPTFHTVEGIHKIFQSKKLMKGAQGDNPLACRGFKRPVILSCMDDGFRLDMTSGEQEGALLQTHVNKIVLAMPVESSVYIVTRRGKDPGKYSCHCIKCDAKEKSVPDEIAAYFTRIVKGSDPDARAGVSTLKPAAQSHVPQPTRRRSEDGPGAHTQMLSPPPVAGGHKRRVSLVDDDKVAAQCRAAAGLVDADAASVSEYIKTSKNEDGDEEDDEETLNMHQMDALQNDMANAALLSPTKAALLDAMMWYHGAIQRNLAESLLSGKEPGTFLVRFSQTKNEYCVSLMSTRGSIQHFVTQTGPDGRLALHGHQNQYDTMIDLVDHYSRFDITSDGDRCINPCPAMRL